MKRRGLSQLKKFILISRPTAVSILAALLCNGCSIDAVIDRPVNKDDIRETIKAHQKEIRICYENALEQTPMLEGRIVMAWTIGIDGHPTNVRVREASPKIQPVAPCLTDAMKTWVFRNTSADSVVTVSYPFIFSENKQFERVRQESAKSANAIAEPSIGISAQEESSEAKPLKPLEAKPRTKP